MLQALMLYALYLVGQNMEFGYWYNMGLVGRGRVLRLSAVAASASASRQSCFHAFLNNHYVGLSVFIGILLEYAFRVPDAVADVSNANYHQV